MACDKSTYVEFRIKRRKRGLNLRSDTARLSSVQERKDESCHAYRKKHLKPPRLRGRLDAEQVAQLQLDAENKLLAALERALNRNETTLAVLPIHLVSRRDGIVASLRAIGYGVEEPR